MDILKIIFTLGISIVYSAGCGGATDIGNPRTIITLTGAYEEADVAEVDSVPAEEVSTCSSDATAEQSITAGSGENEIVLTNFFNYTESTRTITAQYNEDTGLITFHVVESDIDLDCTGTTTASGNVDISFDCDLQLPSTSSCTITFSKTE